MKLRPALLTCAFLLGCAETNYGNLGRTDGTSASSSGSGGGAGSGAGTTTGGSGAGNTGTSSSGTATGTGGAPGTSSSSGTGGMPSTSSSSGGTGGDPYNTPPTCSSMTMAPGGNNANMKPGSACKSCHVLLGQASGKTFDIGGTVYLTAHEPDNCNGVNVSGAVVIITDANNAETQIPVNAAGNFYHADLFGFAALKAPLHARVVYNGKTRKMIASMTTGDCNSCHTENGANSAPGRIMLP